MNHAFFQLFVFCLVAIVGGCTTFLLSNYTKLSKVQASALPTFLFSLALFLWSNYLSTTYDYTLLASLFFGASFIGMTSKKVSSWVDIVLATLIFALVFALSENSFHNFGGKLGLMACVAVVVSVGFRWMRSLFFAFWRKKG